MADLEPVAAQAREGGESARTVLVALTANLAIAVAKGAAAVITGSASMAAEAAHSVADTGNEIFLWVGVRSSHRPADERHPQGYGAERFFWSLMAAVGIFVAGGVLAIRDGIDGLLHPRPLESVGVALVILAVSAVLEGISWVVSRRQLRAGAARRDQPVDDFVAQTSDPAPVTVFFEDSAALVGLGLAAAGILLHEATGSAVWDALGSLAIGALLVYVAFRLVQLNRHLLLGASVPAELVQPLLDQVSGLPWVASVPAARLVYVGPHRITAALEVIAADGRTVDELTDDIDTLRTRMMASGVFSDVSITVVRAAT